MRKALLALAPVLALCGGAASALEPWPTVTDRAALADFRLQADYDTCSAELVGGAEMALTDHLGTGADGEGYYPLLIVEQDTANRYKVGSFVKMKLGNDLAWGKVVAARGNRIGHYRSQNIQLLDAGRVSLNGIFHGGKSLFSWFVWKLR